MALLGYRSIKISAGARSLVGVHDAALPPRVEPAAPRFPIAPFVDVVPLKPAVERKVSQSVAPAPPQRAAFHSRRRDSAALCCHASRRVGSDCGEVCTS